MSIEGAAVTDSAVQPANNTAESQYSDDYQSTDQETDPAKSASIDTDMPAETTTDQPAVYYTEHVDTDTTPTTTDQPAIYYTEHVDTDATASDSASGSDDAADDGGTGVQTTSGKGAGTVSPEAQQAADIGNVVIGILGAIASAVSSIWGATGKMPEQVGNALNTIPSALGTLWGSITPLFAGGTTALAAIPGTITAVGSTVGSFITLFSDSEDEEVEDSDNSGD
ncbi:MAG: hypothetical protein WC527_05880 [Candidatus Margulisiibacteriota bacterium]